MVKIEYLTPASPEERKRYYREEWNIKQVPEYIIHSIQEREFGFDHVGRGPNDRYKVFRTPDLLKRFLKVRTPFAAYCSVAFYDKPRRRDRWTKAELVFDVDAKDIPVRTCECEGVCEICLNEAREIVLGIIDTLKADLGLKNIHVVYSGRGYHIRVLDNDVMSVNSDVRSQIVKYLVGADVPENEYSLDFEKVSYEHFVIPFGYPNVFTKRVKYAILHLTENSELDEVNKKLLKDVLKHRQLIELDNWGMFKNKIGPQRYRKVIKGIASINMSLVDAKVSIDLKRILRLPSSLHSMVSMKCTEVKNIETFDPFDDAVPKFVYERK
ncbi:DNA primase catalytic subunit PriS [Methanobacterium sp. SMA-27]|uniref:DNA primase catalytic subunit PriS n=1 Tax=Methanobacterium sp. SMA-27 TaxID=1495336 RepID=UPI00064E548D|nr:DNA primase catalytic subunit PriS [Methanobacterium sp. SMA-27]